MNTIQLGWIQYNCDEYITITMNTIQLWWIQYNYNDYIFITISKNIIEVAINSLHPYIV